MNETVPVSLLLSQTTKNHLDSSLLNEAKSVTYQKLMYHFMQVLADRIGIPCSLVRGEYNRAWNEILIPVGLEKGAPRYPPKKYMIDLIHECGRLISMDSPEAIMYQSI